MSEDISITLPPELYIIHLLPFYQSSQQRNSTPALHHLPSPSLQPTELSPYHEYQERKAYGDHEVQVYPISHFRASIVGREIPERGTEEGCDKCSRQEDEGDSRDESHIGTVTVVEMVVSLLEICVYLQS